MSWGPGSHLRIIERVLASDRVLLRRRELIESHRASFDYGNIAADLITWKHYGGRENSCHHWSIRERLLRHAHDDAARAFVLGYTCHLAADIAAHHHLVPFHLVRELPAKILAHGYWEARVDGRFVDEPVWHRIDDLRTHRELRSHDELVRHAVPKRALSMGSNRLIFDHVILARSKPRWRRAMERVGRERPPGVVVDEVVERCYARAEEYVATWLERDGEHPLEHLDPSGHDVLRLAKRVRRELRKAHPTRADAIRASVDAAEQFAP